jgi:general secretion pathway protein J
VREDGFTLVELLVALLIFAILSAAGVLLLSQSVRSGEMVDRRLDSSAELRRARQLLSADLGQAAPRLHRDARGGALPAFRGNASFFSLIRPIGNGGNGTPRAGLVRVDYRLADGALLRTLYPMADGSEPLRASSLIRRIVRSGIRYRDRTGAWRTHWDPARPDELPAAIELTTEQEDRGAIRQLFLVGAA